MGPGRYLLVDGYSIVHAWPDLLEMHGRRMVLACEALIRELTGYHDFAGAGVTVVFDGKGRRIEDATERGGIQVLYAPAGTTADDVIERLVAAHCPKLEMTVATDDMREREAVLGLGADVLSSRGLRDLLAKNASSLRDRLDKTRRDASSFGGGADALQL